ncbi:MAG TPA: RnfH family protein [Burkholderiales bacterium]|nr:RnfH family protein [Burkholderiales bacterium]
MRVEVVYALADEQHVLVVELAEGASAREAIDASGIARRVGRIDLQRLHLGRFGRRIAPEARVQEGDRIEILRPLSMSPMEARRLRARRSSRPSGR